MNDVSENFADRLNRIQRDRSTRKGGMGFIVHPDGVVTSIGGRSSRLRFGFPLKGLVSAMVIAVAVKAYLMWFLGTEIYTIEIQRLLVGSAFERLAGIVLMPDMLTAWVVERYEDIYAFVQAGFAATTPV